MDESHMMLNEDNETQRSMYMNTIPFTPSPRTRTRTRKTNHNDDSCQNSGYICMDTEGYSQSWTGKRELYEMLRIYHNKIWQVRPWAKSDPLPALVHNLFWGDTATPTYLRMDMVAFALQVELSIANKDHMACWDFPGSPYWDFPGSPLVKTLPFHCKGHGFDP